MAKNKKHHKKEMLFMHEPMHEYDCYTLNDLVAKIGGDAQILDVSCDGYNSNIVISYARLETDEEFNSRIKKYEEEKQLLRREASRVRNEKRRKEKEDYKTYLRLKEIYG